MLIGAAAAAVVAVILALASVRLRGLGLALLTIAAALFFDNTRLPAVAVERQGQSISVRPSWVGLGVSNPNGHAFFVLAMVVLLACIVGGEPGPSGDHRAGSSGPSGEARPERPASAST